jgi:circadian clock protein KaiC
MLGGKGVFRGSSVLVSGSPGTGKSSVAAAFADAACRRGESCLMFAYEESVSQLIRNMRSIGLNLQQWVDQGLLHIHASRPTLYGLEQHLMQMHELVLQYKPDVVVIDPMSNLTLDAEDGGLKPTLMRLIDFLKESGTTVMFTNLTSDLPIAMAVTQIGVSSLMDSWLMLANLAENGERIRTIQVLKSRGMSHSNQIREFTISDSGVALVDVFMSDSGPLIGHARRIGEENRRNLALEPNEQIIPPKARRALRAKRSKVRGG